MQIKKTSSRVVSVGDFNSHVMQLTEDLNSRISVASHKLMTDLQLRRYYYLPFFSLSHRFYNLMPQYLIVSVSVSTKSCFRPFISPRIVLKELEYMDEAMRANHAKVEEDAESKRRQTEELLAYINSFIITVTKSES
jgi:hypothetical protein